MPRYVHLIRAAAGWLGILAAMPIVLIAGILAWLMMTGHMFSVMSGSMAPGFRPGDAVLVVPGAPGLMHVGDIISYRSSFNSNLIISHRLVAINPVAKTLTTKGDALARADPPVAYGQLIGRVVAVAPGLGRLTDLIKRPAGLALAIYLPALMVLIQEANRLAAAYRPVYRLAGRQ